MVGFPAYKTVKIPEGINVELRDNVLTVSGPLGKVSRRFYHPKIKLELRDSSIIIKSEYARKRERATILTWASHIENMFRGVKEGYEYQLKVVYSHFPVKVYVKGDELIIENFLGERVPRRAKILEGVKVTVEGNLIKVWGIDIEKAGQTAANIELATKIKNYDRRVFQDGIYIIKKPD